MTNINPGAAEDEHPLRFQVATQRYEEFLQAADVEGDKDQRVAYFYEIMTACGGLRAAAQTYDFVSTIPSLADTEAVATNGRRLATELARPDIPDEVKAIYQDLYGEDLRQYTALEDM